MIRVWQLNDQYSLDFNFDVCMFTLVFNKGYDEDTCKKRQW